MKNYKEFRHVSLGDSDIATLIAVGGGHNPETGFIESKAISFGEDANYEAYLVMEPAEIGAHYKKVFECDSWLKIYDDYDRTLYIHGKHIEIYRAGMMGIIIYNPEPKYIEHSYMRYR